MDPLKMLAGAGGGNDADFAQQLQQAFGEGGFDPFSLFAGETRFHSLFITPLSAALRAAITELHEHDSGPLLAVIEQFTRDGLNTAEARARVKDMFAATQGSFVLVLADDQGLSATQQLYFGGFDDAYCEHIVAMFRQDFPDRDRIRAALISLRRDHDRGTSWPELFASADGTDDARTYWSRLAAAVARGQEEGIVPTAERLGELPHWTGAAMNELERAHGLELDGEELDALARTHAIGGEVAAACERSGQLVSAYEMEDEELARLVDLLTTVAVANGDPAAAVRFFREHAEDLDEVLGGCYELALPRFRALAAAMAPRDELLAGAEQLRNADRKAFRHALNREPLWRVTIADPGELLDTHDAAELIDRSATFVAKRLENGTIPCYRSDDDELRIPRQALENWQAVMERYELLD